MSLITINAMTEDEERKRRDNEYMKYIKDHVFGVQKAYQTYCVPLLAKRNLSALVPDEELKRAIQIAGQLVKVHDESKYSEAEFLGYRQHFYPTEAEARDENHRFQYQLAFEKAWSHHWQHNPHHTDYWVSVGKEMPLEYIIEMICDWVSVGNYKGTSIYGWYTTHAKKERENLDEQDFLVGSLMRNTLYIE